MFSSSELGSIMVKKVVVLTLLALMFLTPFLLQTQYGKGKTGFLTTTNTTTTVQNETNSNYRIQLNSLGNCIGSSDGFSLKFSFCDPTQQQTFRFLENGKLEFSSTGRCVSRGRDMTGPLTLRDCSAGALGFRSTNGSYFQITENIEGSEYCLSFKKGSSRQGLPGDTAVLSECTETFSRVNLIEEAAFIARRKALLRPQPESNSYCNFSACSINRRSPPVEILPSKKIERCHNLSECVTVVVKTARRPHLVLRLAQSIRDFTGYDLPIIAYDDGLDPYPEKIMSKIASFSNLQYVIGDDNDLGIALGRTLAVKMVKTRYFLLCDDDLVFSNHTNIEVLAEILDTTDASVVGGRFEGEEYFAGYLNFSSLDKHGNLIGLRSLNNYEGACFQVNETIVGFPNCMRCDTTANLFMAKRADILEVGCWSEELKVAEHVDLFLRLKAAGKKVVWCPKVAVWNLRENPRQMIKSHYMGKRARIKKMRTVFVNIWNFHTYKVHKNSIMKSF